jgi:DMSO/TMAO reductase YedYZ molybdopterin-dependent catalytic subunit
MGRREFVTLVGASLVAASIGGCEESSQGMEVVGALEIDPITSNDAFYIVSFYGMVEVDVASWTLELRKEGEVYASLDYAQLTAMESREREHTLRCIESKPFDQRLSNAIWEGLPLLEIFSRAGIQVPMHLPHMRVTGADGYETSLRTEDLTTPMWLVWRMNGEELPRAHGHPVRILNPGRYGWKNPKQVTAIDFLAEPFVANWEKKYYFGDSPPTWALHYGVQNLVVHPSHMELIDEGTGVRILGKAHAGSDPVVHVEISTDGGGIWSDAELTYAPGADRWTLWRHVWVPPGPGVYTVMTRCRTASGAESTAGELEGPMPYTGSMGLEIEIV